ncbi:LysE family translocator [Myceligenerans salitolerans]|uniref:LysE family translocator n=1 Tax=Myceligenerans salitolerans TaxID=1230528 RepID=A0ABS3I651_9MICO|nr:LysE family translocator [Myceligenerans salitolerans]MBO0608485.1 LysE family translocator [Myceligenerans salitolerans]
MPTLAQLAAFTVASIVLIEIPGPSLLFALGRALTVGRRDALLSVVGNASGVLVQGVAAAVGLGALVAASTTAFTVLKLVGAAYVVYLGIQAIRHRADARAALEQDAVHRTTSGLGAVRTGFVVGVTNPKTVVFLMAFLPQFIAGGAPAAPQLLLLGALFAVLACVSDVVWVLAASQARSWFARRPERLDGLGLTGGVMMIGVGGFLATSHNA